MKLPSDMISWYNANLASKRFDSRVNTETALARVKRLEDDLYIFKERIKILQKERLAEKQREFKPLDYEWDY